MISNKWEVAKKEIIEAGFSKVDIEIPNRYVNITRYPKC